MRGKYLATVCFWKESRSHWSQEMLLLNRNEEKGSAAGGLGGSAARSWVYRETSTHRLPSTPTYLKPETPAGSTESRGRSAHQVGKAW